MLPKLHAARRPSPAMAVALTSLVVAAGGVAVAATPGADGAVDGCFSQRHGELRVVDRAAGETCTAKETAVRLAAADAAGKVAAADTLDGLDSTAFPRRALRTTVERDYPLLEPGQCVDDAVDAGDPAAVGGLVLVTAEPFAGVDHLVLSGRTVVTAGENPVTMAPWRVCNTGPFASDPSAVDVEVLVLR